MKKTSIFGKKVTWLELMQREIWKSAVLGQKMGYFKAKVSK